LSLKTGFDQVQAYQKLQEPVSQSMQFQKEAEQEGSILEMQSAAMKASPLTIQLKVAEGVAIRNNIVAALTKETSVEAALKVKPNPKESLTTGILGISDLERAKEQTKSANKRAEDLSRRTADYDPTNPDVNKLLIQEDPQVDKEVKDFAQQASELSSRKQELNNRIPNIATELKARTDRLDSAVPQITTTGLASGVTTIGSIVGLGILARKPKSPKDKQ
jgi:hypothetical protein